ncbi:MAG: Do family serine endopeptidase [Muribaculaceae bacterium]|nr:Do family serine endopeptidase [Muribaculaceae bacterium]
MNKESIKTAVIAASIATVFSSAVTVFATTTSSNSPSPAPAPTTDRGVENGYYTRTAASAAVGQVDFTKAAESTVNGVVSIKNYASPRYGRGSQGGASPFSDPFFDFFFGNPYQQQPRQGDKNDKDDESSQIQQGLGSGVIISSDGYIVTNNHVIDGADRLEVTLNDNRSFNARVIGADPTTDLALLKIDASDLHVIPMGDSDKLKVGEWVLAVGNPFGFTSTVTSGIVSAKARSISAVTRQRKGSSIETYIQTDAAVNPGNSGGALVNLAGELVGINTAIYSNTGSYAGSSFAVPTSIVKKVVSDIRQFGAVQRAVLGVSISDLTSELQKDKGITAVNEGAYVGSVSERSSAREAGIKEGDVIVAINGTPVKNVAQLQEQVSLYSPGDKITVEYVRDNKRQTAKVTLLNNQGNTNIAKAGTITDLGCAFKPLTDEECRSLNVSQGLKVVGLKDGKFKKAGIKDGFVILDINNMRVTSADDVERIYNAIVKSDEDHVMFITGLYPTGKKVYYAVDLAD